VSPLFSVHRRAHIARATACLLAGSSGFALLAVVAVDMKLHLRGRGDTVDEIVGSAATIALSVVLAWVSATLVLAALAALPGALGAAAARAVSAVTPRVVRRLVTVALGVTVAGGASPALGAPAAPTTTTTNGDPAHAIAAHRGLSAEPAALPSLDRPAAPYVVTVRPGDSLWQIARADLAPGAPEPVIAAAWPRWYDQNRSVIGPDPDLIHPGQQLSRPQ